MKKVITHGGQFHADELMGIAVLSRYMPIGKIIRKNEISEEEFADSSVIVLDIGRKHDTKKWNLDHHQHAEMPAACVLAALAVLDDLRETDRKALETVLEGLLYPISDVDTGKTQAQPGDFNSIVRNFNCVHNGFYEALKFCKSALNAALETAMKEILDEAKYKKLQKIGKVRIQNDLDILIGWKKWATSEDVQFLVTPSNRGNGWNVISRDAGKFPIPPDGNQTFRHNAGFIACYASYKVAVDIALQLTK
jgi:uncharacterized UPF0160 family protein